MKKVDCISSYVWRAKSVQQLKSFFVLIKALSNSRVPVGCCLINHSDCNFKHQQTFDFRISFLWQNMSFVHLEWHFDLKTKNSIFLTLFCFKERVCTCILIMPGWQPTIIYVIFTCNYNTFKRVITDCVKFKCII